MGSGLIQLVSQGIQDLYVTGNPQITFFKVVYRRHTNFSIESVVQNFTTSADFGRTVTCNISHLGDLISKVFVAIEMPSIPIFPNDCLTKFAWCRHLGHVMVKEYLIEIGDKMIDKQYGEWLHIWSEVSDKKKDGLDKMIGNVPEMYQFSNGKRGYQLYIPLGFWFCKQSGLSIPLIALASSDVKIIIKFRALEECYRIGPTHSIKMAEDIVPFQEGDYVEQVINQNPIYGYVMGYDFLEKKLGYIKIKNKNAIRQRFETGAIVKDSLSSNFATPVGEEMVENTRLPFQPSFISAFLYVEYYYLDMEERAKIIQDVHQYLIEQIQFNEESNVKSSTVKQSLSLSHPCKVHLWVGHLTGLVGDRTINDHFNYTDSHIRIGDGFYGHNLIRSAKLVINGQDRFSERSGHYFNYLQPLYHHTTGPKEGINVYSFSLYPENLQPSASINMSRIDYNHMFHKLSSTISPTRTMDIRSYTINYNILRVGFNTGSLVFN